MEDVLEVYQRPRDPECPLVCLDETSKQMIVETREPIAAKPGRKARHDYEYARNGVANLFMMFAPLTRPNTALARHGRIRTRCSLKTQCLDRRIPDKRILTREVATWERNRNTHHAKADWHFTT